MGNFYTNFEVLGGNSTDLVRVAKELGRRAFVVSAKNGNALLFDADCDEQDVVEIERLGKQLSERLRLAVVASMNHDDDHLLLWIFRSGKVTRYESCLQAFGFGWALSRICGGMMSYPFIVAVLGWPVFIFQVFRHMLLVKTTGLSPVCTSFGYNYLSKGERPPGFTEDEIIRV
jgi:hypothetical protein